VGGVDAILNISSVSITGNFQGTLFTGNTTHLGNSSIIALCTAKVFVTYTFLLLNGITLMEKGNLH
jgi:hypothetical protein